MSEAYDLELVRKLHADIDEVLERLPQRNKMKRICDADKTVHFRNPYDATRCLCGRSAIHTEPDLLGEHEIAPFSPTTEKVTCVACATVYCAIKNEPWPSVESAALEDGIYAAVEPEKEIP